mmetsp:Transcript_17818/g.42188  ORF Transcript_17818/g.42188 Transcript_17818/m.42188 type:complete len:245 (-) Transcript_17818:353-1087(-)
MTALPTNRAELGKVAPDQARSFTRTGLTVIGDTSGWTDTPADKEKRTAEIKARRESEAVAKAAEAQAICSGKGILSGLSVGHPVRSSNAPGLSLAGPSARHAAPAATVAMAPKQTTPKSLVALHLEQKQKSYSLAPAEPGEKAKGKKSKKGAEPGDAQPGDWTRHLRRGGLSIATRTSTSADLSSQTWAPLPPAQVSLQASRRPMSPLRPVLLAHGAARWTQASAPALPLPQCAGAGRKTRIQI